MSGVAITIALALLAGTKPSEAEGLKLIKEAGSESVKLAGLMGMCSEAGGAEAFAAFKEEVATSNWLPAEMADDLQQMYEKGRSYVETRYPPSERRELFTREFCVAEINKLSRSLEDHVSDGIWHLENAKN